MGEALNLLAQAVQQRDTNEAIWIALIANIAIVLVAIINGAQKVRKIETQVTQVNDAVNHRHPGEPRLLDLVKMTHEQSKINAESHGRLGVDVQDIRHDLTRLDHKVDDVDTQVRKLDEKVDCVEDKLKQHVEWEEDIHYGGKHGTSEGYRRGNAAKSKDAGEHHPDEDQDGHLFDPGQYDASGTDLGRSA